MRQSYGRDHTYGPALCLVTKTGEGTRLCAVAQPLSGPILPLPDPDLDRHNAAMQNLWDRSVT